MLRRLETQKIQVFGFVQGWTFSRPDFPKERISKEKNKTYKRMFLIIDYYSKWAHAHNEDRRLVHRESTALNTYRE